MSKKTFAAAPKPKPLSDDQINAYVSGGSGHDTAPPASPPEREAAGPTKRLSLDLPEEVHRRFKVACAATGRKMGGELLTLIKTRIAELEAELHE